MKSRFIDNHNQPAWTHFALIYYSYHHKTTTPHIKTLNISSEKQKKISTRELGERRQREGLCSLVSAASLSIIDVIF